MFFSHYLVCTSTNTPISGSSSPISITAMKSRATGGLSRKKLTGNHSGTSSIGHMIMSMEMEGTNAGISEELDLSKAVHKDFLALLSHLADPHDSECKVSKR